MPLGTARFPSMLCVPHRRQPPALSVFLKLHSMLIMHLKRKKNKLLIVLFTNILSHFIDTYKVFILALCYFSTCLRRFHCLHFLIWPLGGTSHSHHLKMYSESLTLKPILPFSALKKQKTNNTKANIT